MPPGRIAAFGRVHARGVGAISGLVSWLMMLEAVRLAEFARGPLPL